MLGKQNIKRIHYFLRCKKLKYIIFQPINLSGENVLDFAFSDPVSASVLRVGIEFCGWPQK